MTTQEARACRAKTARPRAAAEDDRRTGCSTRSFVRSGQRRSAAGIGRRTAGSRDLHLSGPPRSAASALRPIQHATCREERIAATGQFPAARLVADSHGPMLRSRPARARELVRVPPIAPSEGGALLSTELDVSNPQTYGALDDTNTAFDLPHRNAVAPELSGRS